MAITERQRLPELYVKNAAGLYVPVVPISGVESAAVGDVPTRQADGTLAMAAPTGGGGTASGARVTRAAANSAQANNTHAQPAFDTVVRDDGGYWNAAFPTRFTVPAGRAGRHIIQVSAQRGGSLGDFVNIAVRKNASSWNGEVSLRGLWLATAALLYLADGDYVELNLFNLLGTSLTLVTGSPVMEIARIG